MRRFSVATTCAWGGGWGVGGGAHECGASLLRPPVLGPMNAALPFLLSCAPIADGASSLGHFSFFSCNPSVQFRIMFMCSNKRDFGHIYQSTMRRH